MFFRCLVLFFTIATIALGPWAIVGSWKNEGYLTKNYLIGVQITELNVSQLFGGVSSRKAKRAVEEVDALVTFTPTPTTDESIVTAFVERDILSDIESVIGNVNGDITSALNGVTSQLATATGDVAAIVSEISALAATASIPESLASLAVSIADDFNLETVLQSLNYSDLGLADYYSVGYWGYCRGYMGSGNNSDANLLSHLGSFGENFNKDDVQYVWCSDPKPGFKFDPLEMVKREMTNAITDDVDGLEGLPSLLSETIKAELIAIIASVTYDDLDLPGNLKNDLTLLNNLTKAALAMLIAGTCLAFISFVFQLLGLCASPHNGCLSCLNFLLMLLFCLCILLGAGLSTGAYVYVRKEVNNNVEEFGLKSFLSVQYYAFAWAAMVAALLAVLFAAIGYCCGCFSGNRKKNYRKVPEPQMAYDHQQNGYYKDPGYHQQTYHSGYEK